ncbi:hypothetical protein ATE67_07425 [Sphingopyxis sp. H050]|jgi:hemerythrin-like domain-containing protein|uniref:hemerythrin domain-containing protein n=1 Tax=Sphingopyxis sp. H050 TaxID=1759072 RepID=UPI000736600C|nr:hemerythrin domain-containing protein [Sphingopyxis sp. H050]KTE21138.1 hypothetical protein ATE67_07425 [Sphingopyxis sp. H050]
MPKTREIERLRAEHAALTTLSRFLMEMVSAPQPPRATELTAVRGMLRDTLVRHLKCEDWALYPRLRATGDAAINRMAKEFVDEMGHLASDFDAYDRRWTDEAALACWADFCAETTGILHALGMRIEREDRDLYPVAETIAIAEAGRAEKRGGRRAA